MTQLSNEIANFEKYLTRIITSKDKFYYDVYKNLFQDYFAYLVSIQNNWFPKRKSYDDNTVAESLFIKIPKFKDIKLHIKYEFYALLKSTKRINNQIIRQSKKNNRSLSEEITLLLKYVKESVEFVRWSEKRLSIQHSFTNSYFIRGTLHPMELYWASLVLFQNKCNYQKYSNLTLHPTSVFLIRQALELRLRNIFGIDDIIDENGNYLHATSSLFIEILNQGLKDNLIQFPIKISIIKKIFEWTNYYIHNAKIPFIWEIDWAHSILKSLFTDDNTIDFKKIVKIDQKFYNDSVEDIVKKYFTDKKNKKNIVISRMIHPHSTLISI